MLISSHRRVRGGTQGEYGVADACICESLAEDGSRPEGRRQVPRQLIYGLGAEEVEVEDVKEANNMGDELERQQDGKRTEERATDNRANCF